MQREKEKTLYLAKQNLAFRGHREDENAKNKGNFFGVTNFNGHI